MDRRNEGFEELHRRLLADRRLQFDLPVRSTPELPDWLKALGRLIAHVAPVLPYLFWGAVAIGLLIILALIVAELAGVRWRWPFRRARVVTEEEPAWQPEAAPARALLGEADALAADGRFAAAIHLLLQRSIEDIARRRPSLLRPSLTARDIAAADAIPERARAAFAGMARLVERSLFAAAGADAAVWAEARDAYARFALPGHWR